MWEGGIWDTASTTTGTAGVGHDWKRADGYVYITKVLKAQYSVWSASISTCTWSVSTNTCNASTGSWM